jgi:hypothetical protein
MTYPNRVANLRQRVVGNANPIKLGRCFDFLNEWYGFNYGGDRKSSGKLFHLKNPEEPHTQKELAETYGISQRTMNNYMQLTKTIPELEDLIDTGIVSKNTALAMIRELSTAGEKLAMMDDFKEEVARENREKQKEGGRIGGKGGNEGCVISDTSLRDLNTNTRNRLAKKAGVSTGTVAKYNKVMKSGNQHPAERKHRWQHGENW